MDITPWARCLGCGAPIQIDEKYFEAFFENCEIVCNSCSQPVDWWKTALNEIAQNFMLNHAFHLVAARTMVFRLILKPNETTSYKLVDFGIPDNAKVLYVNYTPYGNLFPLEVHGNVSTIKKSREQVYLWPRPLQKGETPNDTEVDVFVTWVPHSRLDDSWKNLISSFEAYVADDFLSVVVPANVAVESALSITLNGYLPQFVSKARIELFLKDAATYSHQLNVVLPLLVGLLKLPVLPGHIRGELNVLRSLRNDIAHLGGTKHDLGKQRCAELLCAALFGFQYILLLKRKLSLEQGEPLDPAS